MGYNANIRMQENLHRGCMWWRPDLTTQQDMYDIAAATQMVFEYCVVNLGAWAKIHTGSKNLAVAGGGALNRQAIERLKSSWDNVYVPKNPGDSGSCIGAVLAKTKIRTSLDNCWHR